MSGARHPTVVGRPSAVRLPAFLLLSGLLLAVPFSVTANAQNPPATQTATAHPFAIYIDEAAQRFRIPAAWIRAVMRVESAGDVRAISSAGAMGLMQIMPETWAELRVRHRLGRDPYDPRDNILAGAAYLREMYDRYGSPGFLAAYNAGPGRYEE
jgi:soluble lytic murein transglycosylase-like protein